MAERQDFYYGMNKTKKEKETLDVKADDVESFEKPNKYFNAGTSTIVLESGKEVAAGDDIGELTDKDKAKFALNGSLGIRE